MKLQDLIDMWMNDCDIIPTKLVEEAAGVPRLHAKYWAIHAKEKIHLATLETTFKVLRAEKIEWLVNGETAQTRAAGWVHPGRLIKRVELQEWLDKDAQIIEASQKIAIQREKVEFTHDVIKAINNRGYLLRTILDNFKFQAGG